ncbi:MAG: aminotransferase class V-fold PLP-dependent enzyme, partial [Candidatus Njordarchaeota archaeon]
MEEIRRLFPALREVTYINTASQGLLSLEQIEVIKKYAEERKYGNKKWVDWYMLIDKDLREMVARFIGADISEIGFVPNTSFGLNMIANSIKWEKGQNIVTNDMEFPTNLFIWQKIAERYGLEVRYAKNHGGVIPEEEYEKLVDEKTRAIVVSWVEFSSGFTHDLEFLSKLAKKNDAYLIVDGIQAIGALPLDAKKIKIDAISCGFQKWMLGIGGGFVYINDEIIHELDPPFAGWLSDKKPFDFSFRKYSPTPTAKMFEIGTPNFVAYLAEIEALKLIEKISINKIYNHNKDIANYLRKKLTDIGIKTATPKESPSP